MTITIFVSYSHHDESYRYQLQKHLARLSTEHDIEFWFDGKMLPGDALDAEIRGAFKRSAIFLALGSHNYLHSDYCFNKEYLPALNRARRKTMRVVVALIGTCDWKHTRMANYKLLPRDGKPVDQWRNRNEAFLDIVEGLRAVVAVVRKERNSAASATQQLSTSKKRKPATKAVPRPVPKAPAGKQAKDEPRKPKRTPTTRTEKPAKSRHTPNAKPALVKQTTRKTRASSAK